MSAKASRCDSRGKRRSSSSGVSGNSGSDRVASSSSSLDQHTASPSTRKMGGEQKCPSSSREMRNMAEKMRRDKLNNYISELAGIVPMGSGATKRIDKTSVLRLAANYIRMNKVLCDDDKETEGSSSNNSSPNGGIDGRVGQMLGGTVAHSLAEAVGGFLLVVTSTGKIVFITEAVDQFFGHSQVDLLGHSVYNVIHPDDHDIFRQQLHPKDNSRRSFFCRMMEKALSRNDPGRYEIIHIVGQLRPIPSTAAATTGTVSPKTPVAADANTSSDRESDEYNTDDDDDDSISLRGAAARQRMGTHMMVSFVRVVKDRPITELSLVESTQDEYITRHGMDSKILYTDHRISVVTGMMPGDVIGTSAFSYMHPDDMLWSFVAQRLMLTSAQGQGVVTYRLQSVDGKHIHLRSRGYLEVNKQTGEVESFVCINTVLSVKDASDELLNQRRMLLPMISGQNSDDYLSGLSSSLPPQIVDTLKKMMNPETMKKMLTAGLPTAAGPGKQTLDIDYDQSDVRDPNDFNTNKSQEGSSLNHHEGLTDFNMFQGRPKRLCGFERTPSSLVQQDFQNDRGKVFDNNEWCNVSSKIKSSDDFSGVVTKKFSFDQEPYQSCASQQSKFLASPQMCSPTVTVHKPNETYPLPTNEQQFGSTNYIHQKFAHEPSSDCDQQNMNCLKSPTQSFDSGIVSPSGHFEYNQIIEKSPMSIKPCSPNLSPMSIKPCSPMFIKPCSPTLSPMSIKPCSPCIDLLSPETHDHRKLSPNYPSPGSISPNNRGPTTPSHYEPTGTPHLRDNMRGPTTPNPYEPTGAPRLRDNMRGPTTPNPYELPGAPHLRDNMRGPTTPSHYEPTGAPHPNDNMRGPTTPNPYEPTGTPHPRDNMRGPITPNPYELPGAPHLRDNMRGPTTPNHYEATGTPNPSDNMRGPTTPNHYDPPGASHPRINSFKGTNYHSIPGSSNGLSSPGSLSQIQPSIKSPGTINDRKTNMAAYRNDGNWNEGLGTEKTTIYPPNCSNNGLPHNQNFQSVNSSHTSMNNAKGTYYPHNQFSPQPGVIDTSHPQSQPHSQPQPHPHSQQESGSSSLHPGLERDFGYSSLDIDINLSSHNLHPQQPQSKVDHRTSFSSRSQSFSTGLRVGGECENVGLSQRHHHHPGGLGASPLAPPSLMDTDPPTRGEDGRVSQHYQREYLHHTQHEGKLL